ncbi:MULTISPECIES: NAD(P)-dependent oxidoreductase [Hyphomonas]|uniref:Beta-hydroxyacid dehydrogenase, 3-hydroxyisobutyrate dehydrogenase n=2 Tax=Hyphomonas adhaerens TaxID=81029 RepID=A0A069E0G6_9PROT|nr:MULTISPECIES: NAD(P)-dependent oxidoreductase [Hyphomonas]KCZ82793.1 beta-hydroxyacid dehydrogenase, 3-hydroxyisobutyrate dehydrogenase [Hyphomonas adhaerens MHS-3]MBB40391.1 NAD(P)-dependent oxidoreductase [Hyphomonas sp.]HAE28649.1 NAD(P)-dependent oxidoreductase [Hyphomonas adhaerens]|tara:strand:- start:1881 stop:2792 length:912 start_codon:yes stop_codon:yes gene_type:complete
MRIGFLGLGNMGANMAMVLQRSGLQLKVHDIDPAKAESHIQNGAIWAETPADCARDVDIFITSLPKPDVVQAVMAGEQGALSGLQAGTIWVDTTTNDVGVVEALAEQAAKIGVKTVDSPLTGAVDGARRGELTLFAGGDEAVVAACEPILSRMGRVIYCGRLGTGNAVKLVTNYLWFTHAAVIGEGLMLGKRAGVPLDVLWDAIKDSVGDSFVARHDAPSIFAGHYDPSFSLELCVKDLRLCKELAERGNVPIPIGAKVAERFALAAETYGGSEAELKVAKLIEDEVGEDLRLEGDWPLHWEA